ncbi:hypothetical protein XENORESO_006147 [Xenotaenia resolanae]|uniref:Secreted protein n=1 Tax=Xenotaenia resolanae TaxID=208358 RepID=A0ABV0WCZ4_9TELE
MFLCWIIKNKLFKVSSAFVSVNISRKLMTRSQAVCFTSFLPSSCLCFRVELCSVISNIRCFMGTKASTTSAKRGNCSLAEVTPERSSLSDGLGLGSLPTQTDRSPF